MSIGMAYHPEGHGTRRRAIFSWFWSITHTGLALGVFFKAIPFNSEVIILMESGDVAYALMDCEKMAQQRFDPIQYTNSPQWREMLVVWKYNGIQRVCRPFYQSLDEPFIEMRMIAICEAEETMHRGVSERDNPSTFLA
jgi:hypothetical protein